MAKKLIIKKLKKKPVSVNKKKVVIKSAKSAPKKLSGEKKEKLAVIVAKPVAPKQNVAVKKKSVSIDTSGFALPPPVDPDGNPIETPVLVIAFVADVFGIREDYVPKTFKQYPAMYLICNIKESDMTPININRASKLNRALNRGIVEYYTKLIQASTKGSAL